MRFSSSSFNIHASHPHYMTGQTKAFISRNLVTVLSDLFFHIFVNLTITVVPIAILNFTSSVQPASFLTLLPKYTKEYVYTCSSRRTPAPATVIAITSSVFVMTFVFAALINMLYSFAALSTRLTSSCNSSGDVASKTMSSAYSRLLITFPPILNHPANPCKAFRITCSYKVWSVDR